MAARRKKTGAKVNIPMCLACVLLCLTLFSVHFSSGVVARYTATADSGDSARVIKFGNLTAAETVGQPYIAPGMELNWNISVSFTGSESATYVFVELTGIHSATAATVTLFDGGPDWTVNTAYWTAVDTVPGVYYHALDPNATMDGVALFANNGDSTAVPDTMTAAQIAAIGTREPAFRASVVQSNGFDTVADAWASLESNHP